MKMILPFLLALFPFLHDTKYVVTLQSCEKDNIVVNYEGKMMNVSLFNLVISDDVGWNKTCSLLEKAETIYLEIDSTSAISEPLAAYIFADTNFIQEELVREELAYTLIHNPEYSYESKLLEIEESNRTMATSVEKTDDVVANSYGWIFLVILFLLWSAMLIYLLSKKYNFLSYKHWTKDRNVI